MIRETQEIIHSKIDFLPLKSYANIVQGNALRLDWEDVIPKDRLRYIMGNPPFLGYGLQSKNQKSDILSIYIDENGKPYKTAGKIDYVAGWYFKAAQMIAGTNIRVAFVSTNSITQGEQVAGVWKPLYDQFRIHIDFAYRTFIWDSEATDKAHVHVVIVGFSTATSDKKKLIFEGEQVAEAVNINPYLCDAPTVFIESRKVTVSDVPAMTTGNRPADGGHLMIEADDYLEFTKKEPKAQKYIKKLIGSTEFINNKERYCLWLVGVSPSELKSMPEVMKRINLCKQDRLQGAPDRQKLADTPALFRETKAQESEYIVVPRHSSENRRYIPFGFVDPIVIATDAVLIIPDANLYHFGVLESNVHMAWVRSVCGRLKSDYRYSRDIVYNNFPWPTPTPDQKQRIEQTAQGILDARALYPDSSLADLYDPLTMPPELRKAHDRNNVAVMKAYGFPTSMSEAECVAALMKMYQELTK